MARRTELDTTDRAWLDEHSYTRLTKLARRTELDKTDRAWLDEYNLDKTGKAWLDSHDTAILTEDLFRYKVNIIIIHYSMYLNVFQMQEIVIQ